MESKKKKKEVQSEEMALADTPGFMQPRVKSYVPLL